MSDATQSGPVLAADGTPLKRSLARALRVQKIRALLLIAPLLLFVLLTFVVPIVEMLFRSVENEIVENTLPETTSDLATWDGSANQLPDAAVFEALYFDMFTATELKRHTRLGTRLNYESTGFSSLFRQSGRKLDDAGKDYRKAFSAVDKAWTEPETWYELVRGADGAPGADGLVTQQRTRLANLDDQSIKGALSFTPSTDITELLPRTVQEYTVFALYTERVEGKEAIKTKPWESVYVALAADLATADVANYDGPKAQMLRDLAADPQTAAPPDFPAIFADIDEDWASVETWRTIQTHSPAFTSGYFLNAVDMKKTPDGIQVQPENKQILITLFMRTLFMSLVIMGACILLGYPVAWILANLPASKANLLMILVLLPFWTSLLVRTSAWKVMLQQQVETQV